MAGTLDFDLVAIRTCRIPTFEIGIDGSVFRCYRHPARLASPGSRRDDCLKTVGQVEDLRSCHKSSLFSRQVSGEVLMKLRRVKISETVCCLLYCSRLAQVTWEALSVICLILSRVWHVGRHIDQSGNRGVRPGFSN